MSTSSRYLLFGSSLFRTQSHIPISTLRRTRFLIHSPKSMQFLKLCRNSSSSSVAELDTSVNSRKAHPWPEWIAFVDKLKTEGYIVPGADVDDTLYQDIKVLDSPCHSFARDRYDIIGSLSKIDIQTVAESGCPNYHCKPVNSAKRLRAYIGLKEGNVCGTCDLRGTCNKAYKVLVETEADARTVDVVRLLLMYALDPSMFGDDVRPPRITHLEDSAKRLLSELVQLSEAAPKPPPAVPVIRDPKPKEKKKRFLVEDRLPNLEPKTTVELKRGDWLCPQCNFSNFARNVRCLKCEKDAPKRGGSQNGELPKGDWLCPECNYSNFARNMKCLKCEAKAPINSAMKRGDWNCPGCGFMNFANNTKCKRCPECRPQRLFGEGEWECPSCNYLNFKRNTVCLSCKDERPTKPSSEYDDVMWKTPR